MTNPAPEAPGVAQLLSVLNQLSFKAFSCRTQRALGFLIVNDTYKLIRYDQASLWDMSSGKPSFLNMSGESAPDTDSELIQETRKRIQEVPNLNEPSVVRWEGTPSGGVPVGGIAEPKTRAALWLPIAHDGVVLLGLWLERWHLPNWSPDEIAVLKVLAQGYGMAWDHLRPVFKPKRTTKVLLGYGSLALLFLLFFLPVSLRVVAPCEVVAKDPILVTAPLDGIVAEIKVKPGQLVKKGDLLFAYDKEVPMEDLNVAGKQVEIAQSQLNRSMTLGLNDPKALTEAGVWKLQLEKEKLSFELAKYRADQLDVKAPADGVVVMHDPDQWRGRPVQVGERVLVLSDPAQTKVKIWLSESDNIPIHSNELIRVFLNIHPAHTLYARLVYVADYSVISEKGVPSFTAEAEWVDPNQDLHLGLKGTAVLYGEKVSLFYWLMRKPWTKLRELTGI